MAAPTLMVVCTTPALMLIVVARMYDLAAAAVGKA